METRLAQTDDAAALAAMHQLCFGVATWSFHQIRGSLALPTTRAYIFQNKAVPQGFIISQQVEEEAEILTFCVVPQARRKGIGQKLLRAILKELPERGVTRVFLEVAADNEPALAFYKKYHFQQSGKRAGYYQRSGQNIDAIVLSLDLPKT